MLTISLKAVPNEEEEEGLKIQDSHVAVVYVWHLQRLIDSLVLAVLRLLFFFLRPTINTN